MHAPSVGARLINEELTGEGVFSPMLDYEKQGKIGIFTINRPEARNAMNIEGLQELHDRMLHLC